MDIKVTIPDKGFLILESWLGLGQVPVWLQHAIDNKLRKRLDASILEHTNLNPAKLSEAEKFSALKDIPLPTRDDKET